MNSRLDDSGRDNAWPDNPTSEEQYVLISNDTFSISISASGLKNERKSKKEKEFEMRIVDDSGKDINGQNWNKL